MAPAVSTISTAQFLGLLRLSLSASSVFLGALLPELSLLLPEVRLHLLRGRLLPLGLPPAQASQARLVEREPRLRSVVTILLLVVAFPGGEASAGGCGSVRTLPWSSPRALLPYHTVAAFRERAFLEGLRFEFHR
ncbi:uncharacterized protein LOC121042851 isoform X2 [Herpailurus yagouaroundi]|uniref:uncharacterized protein LOC121042851 isoform X2 n=1 Tax=Herpailurus yagouaroundi TaxID=1608482 RepID=UPI001AD7D031|nr:uncharacterized protein LOC121042851 isoform X2 [Puma yagouaroundi]